MFFVIIKWDDYNTFYNLLKALLYYYHTNVCAYKFESYYLSVCYAFTGAPISINLRWRNFVSLGRK